jgi:hypothetical protein
MLSDALVKNDLHLYKKAWRTKYLGTYIVQMASKRDYKERLKIIRAFKDYPELYLKVLKGERISLPRDIKSKIPGKFLLKQMLRVLALKFKYM